MKSVIIGTVAYVLTATAAMSAPALKADVDCRPAGGGPVYDCMIRLADTGTGAPISGAQFSVTAAMRSMPMAHNVRPVAAVPGKDPGTYTARLALEMPGSWTVMLRLSSPVHDQIEKTVDFVASR